MSEEKELIEPEDIVAKLRKKVKGMIFELMPDDTDDQEKE